MLPRRANFGCGASRLVQIGRDAAWLRRVSPLGQNTIQRLLPEPTRVPRPRTVDTVAEILGLPPGWLIADARSVD